MIIYCDECNHKLAELDEGYECPWCSMCLCDACADEHSCIGVID